MRESLCRVRGCSGCIDCVQHSCAPAGASNASKAANMLMTAMQSAPAKYYCSRCLLGHRTLFGLWVGEVLGSVWGAAILDFECVDSKSSQVESSLYHGGRCET